MLVRITLGLAVFVTSVMILTVGVVVLTTMVVTILTTDIIEHRTVRTITVIHLIDVRSAVLRILLIVGIGITIWISIALILL